MKKQAGKIVIIGNGEQPSSEVLHLALKKADMIIAADGGSKICQSEGIVPDIITGDMDSSLAGLNDIFPHTRILKITDQDSSDMEKAVAIALEYNPKRLNILAALGYRTDHLLANLSFFYELGRKWKDKVEICIYDNWGKLIYLAEGSHTFHPKQGGTVSFFCLGEIKYIKLEGFRYNVTIEDLQKRFRSLSNVYEQEECRLMFKGEGIFWYECFESKKVEVKNR